MSKVTYDHDKIRRWAESRDGHPAKVIGTGKRNDPGILRIDFPGYSGKHSLREISWDEFFQKFDDSNLAFLYQEKTKSGNRSNFNKLVSRDTAEGTAARRRPSATRSRASTAKKTPSRARASAKKTTSARAGTAKKPTSTRATSTKKAASSRTSATRKPASTRAKKTTTTRAKKTTASRRRTGTARKSTAR